MLTKQGLKRKSGLLRRLGEPGDQEFNAIIQAAVRALDRLGESRAPSCSDHTPQQVVKPGN